MYSEDFDASGQAECCCCACCCGAVFRICFLTYFAEESFAAGAQEYGVACVDEGAQVSYELEVVGSCFAEADAGVDYQLVAIDACCDCGVAAIEQESLDFFDDVFVGGVLLHGFWIALHVH